jgi:hypothetical protein
MQKVRPGGAIAGIRGAFRSTQGGRHFNHHSIDHQWVSVFPIVNFSVPPEGTFSPPTISQLSQLISVWGTEDISDKLRDFFKAIQLNYWFKTSSWNLYVIVFYFFIAFLIFVIINILYVSYGFTKKKFSFMLPVHCLK